jgi:hypothetical protein
MTKKAKVDTKNKREAKGKQRTNHLRHPRNRSNRRSRTPFLPPHAPFLDTAYPAQKRRSRMSTIRAQIGIFARIMIRSGARMHASIDSSISTRARIQIVDVQARVGVRIHNTRNRTLLSMRQIAILPPTTTTTRVPIFTYPRTHTHITFRTATVPQIRTNIPHLKYIAPTRASPASRTNPGRSTLLPQPPPLAFSMSRRARGQPT